MRSAEDDQRCLCYQSNPLPAGYDAPTCNAAYPCCVRFAFTADPSVLECDCYNAQMMADFGLDCPGKASDIDTIETYTDAQVVSACPP